MDWRGRRQSSNVEDRRGISGGGILTGGGIVGVIIYLIVQFMGGSSETANQVVEQVNNQIGQSGETRELTPEEKELGDFVATVFADTEDVWSELLKNSTTPYRYPKMVLFTGNVSTGCGSATSAVGPFYCPADEKVYMDLDFFNELKTRFGAKGGDFAIAYVIAHEVGHHVQHILGTNEKVRRAQRGLSEKEQNKLSVAQELQADFYAGIFAHYIRKYLDADDIDEALSAAQAVGDDAIQRKVQGHVNPDSFTHGTSAQRKEWFLKGYETGDISQGNTFN
ncbi:MAG: neutral zinc metallopeptidase [Flavobacteriia bacterium]|nr:neutral zinc metallopeptidase [Flavobacteriia bacterium]OJX39332.1 MAG: metalloprotease [Flavobacteriia bacterium 40-80]